MKKLLSCLLVTVGLFFGAYILSAHVLGTGIQASASKQAFEASPAKYKHTRIADLKVGERVVVSTDDTVKPTQVDPATWRKVTLFAEETWEDGTHDTINIQTLAPPEWFTAFDAKIGSIVPIPLDLQEMGLDENLLAKVMAIEQCPEIRAGPGRVVLTTVNHLNPNVCELAYSTSEGVSETIRPTASHRFYSLDRNDWIHIVDAKQGERLRGLGHSVLTVLALKPTGTTERVYNMTVEEEHVYHVGLQNLLAHNANCIKVIGRLDDTKHFAGKDGYDVLNMPSGWGVPANDNWVQTGISSKQTFMLASPIEGNMIQKVGDYKGDLSVYGRELSMLGDAGYVLVGKYAVHPDRLQAFLINGP